MMLREKMGQDKLEERALQDEGDVFNSSILIESTQGKPLVADVEYFIRKTFETDPQLGCEMLFRHYYQPLCSHAVRFLYSKAVAEDIVSEVFYQFYLKKTYRNINTSYRAYLYKAVRHRAYNYLRWETNRTTDLAAAENLGIQEAQHPDSVTQFEELAHAVETAINTLPPQRRKIYLMHRFEGKNYNEISEELHIAPKTVEGQIRKASHFLRDLLKNKWTLLVIGLFTDTQL